MIQAQKKSRPTAHRKRENLWEAKGLDPIKGGRKSYYGTTAEEASTKAARSYRVDKTGTLAGYYYDCYVPTLLGRSDNWITQIAWAMEGFVLPMFGESPLEDIDRQAAQKAFNRWAAHKTQSGTKMKGTSLNRLRIVWSCVMNLAVEDDLITKNPLSKIRIADSVDPEHVVLKPAQLWHLATNCSELLRPIVLVQGFAGLRVGEACGLTWGHMRSDILKVRQQVIQPKGGAVLTPKLKTKQSRRDIPLPKGLVQLLKKCNQSSSLYVCSNDSGGFLTPTGTFSRLAKESVELGLPKMGTHDLRHTFTSLLENEFEAPRRVVDAILGRAGSGSTDSYSHTFNEQLLRWSNIYWNRVSTQSTTKKCRTSSFELG